MHYALDIEAWTGSGTATLRFATISVATPGGLFYDGRLADPGMMSRTVGSLSSAASAGVGGLTLTNADGGLDALLGYGFAGRPYTLRTFGEGQDPSLGAVVARGIIEGFGSGALWTEIAFAVADQLGTLQKPFLTARYAGTTTDGTMTTAEGDEDLKDQIKPRVFGSVVNMTPPAANRFRLVYQVSAGAVASIAVYDGGVPLTHAGDVPSLSALLAATFPNNAGTNAYFTCLALGLFRVDDQPIRGLTADVTEGATLADRSAARVAARMLAAFGVAYDVASFEALNVALAAGLPNDGEAGLVVTDESAAIDLVHRVLSSVGAFLVPTSTGALKAFRLSAPSGTPVDTYTLRDLGQNTRIEVEETESGAGTPTWSVVLQYARSWTTQDAGGLAGNVTTQRREFVTSEWRKATAQNAATRTGHPNAVEMTFDTLLTNAADAQAEAARRLGMFGQPRIVLTADLDEERGRRELGDVVSVRVPRFGWGNDKLFVVRGREDDFKRRRVVLTLWG